MVVGLGQGDRTEICRETEREIGIRKRSDFIIEVDGGLALLPAPLPSVNTAMIPGDTAAIFDHEVQAMRERPKGITET